MPGSGIPDKLRDWPVGDDGKPDINGMAEFCAEKIKQSGVDYREFSARVDQAALHDIMNRLTDAGGGIGALRDGDVQHLLNSLALAISADDVHEASGCLEMIRAYVKQTTEESN